MGDNTGASGGIEPHLQKVMDELPRVFEGDHECDHDLEAAIKEASEHYDHLVVEHGAAHKRFADRDAEAINHLADAFKGELRAVLNRDVQVGMMSILVAMNTITTAHIEIAQEHLQSTDNLAEQLSLEAQLRIMDHHVSGIYGMFNAVAVAIRKAEE